MPANAKLRMVARLTCGAGSSRYHNNRVRHPWQASARGKAAFARHMMRQHHAPEHGKRHLDRSLSQPPQPRFHHLRLARCRGTDPPARLRRPLPRHLRRLPRPLRAAGPGKIPAHAEGGRPPRTPPGRGRPGPYPPRHTRGADRHRRSRPVRQRLPRRTRRPGRAQHGILGRHGPAESRQCLRRRLHDADGGQRPPDCRVRHASPDRNLRRPANRRPLVRHHVPVRTASRLLAGRHHNPRRAGRRRRARPPLPPARQQDVDLGRRPRRLGEHRPPGAGQGPRPGRPPHPRHTRHLALHHAEIPARRRRHARRAQRRRRRRPQPQNGLSAAPPTACSTSAKAATPQAAAPAPSATWSAKWARACPRCSR